MTSFREAASADADAIRDLRRRCFPEDDIAKDFPVARAFIAEAEGRPVAHLAFVGQTYVIEGREYAGALAVDAMTDPAFRRRGLFQRLGAFARDAIRNDYALSTAWQIRPAVLPAMVHNGWLPVLRAPVMVRPVWRRGGAGAGAGAVDLPRREAFLAHRAHVRQETSRFDAPYYSVSSDGGAYVVTRRTVLRGYRTLAVVDLAGNARALLKRAVAGAGNATLAAALLSLRHPSLPLLLSMGFLPSPHRFRFLVNVFDAGIDPRRARWALTWADTDHL